MSIKLDCPYECDSNGLLKWKNMLRYCPHCKRERALAEEAQRREQRRKMRDLHMYNVNGKRYKR